MPDYSRFDKIVVDDSDEDELPALDESHKRSVPSLLAQHDAMTQLASWLKDLNKVTELTDGDNAKLIRFVAIQDKVSSPDQKQRHAAITRFLEEDEAWQPPISALVALCHVAEDATTSETDEKRQLCGARVMLLAMSSLNLLAAFYLHGAPKVLRALEEEPNGALAQRYDRFEFAKELVAKRPPGLEAKRRQADAVEDNGVEGGGGSSSSDGQDDAKPDCGPRRRRKVQAELEGNDAKRGRASPPDLDRMNCRLPLSYRLLRVTAPVTRRLRVLGSSVQYQGGILLCAVVLRFAFDMLYYGHSTFWLFGGQRPHEPILH